jgi:hypothetical protein
MYTFERKRRVPSRSTGVVITKVTETVRALTATQAVNSRKLVKYPSLLEYWHHVELTIILSQPYHLIPRIILVLVVWLANDDCQLDMVPIFE